MKRTLTSLATLLLALVLASCGGDDDDAGSGDGPVAFAPADTFLYLEGTISFDGPGADNVETIAAKFPGGEDLEGTIATAIDEAFASDPSGPQLTYAEDFEPWLGERAGLAFTDLSAFETEPVDTFDSSSALDALDESPALDTGETASDSFTLIIETTDPDAARATLEQSEEGFEETEYEGNEMIVADDTAIAFLPEFVVAAETEEAVQQAIDASSGESLADADDFSYDAGETDGAEALAFGWVDLGRVFELALAEAEDAEVTPEQIQQIFDQVGLDPEAPISFALTADSDEVGLHSSVGLTEDSDVLGEGLSDLIGELPSDAAVASSCPGCIESFVAGFRIGFEQSAAEDDVSAEEAAQIFEQSFGLSFDELTGALGDGVFFARPGGLLGVEAGALFGVEDEAAAEDLLSAAELLLGRGAGPGVRVAPLTGAPEGATGFTVTTPDLPAPIEVIHEGDRLAVGIGDGVAAELLSPTETLADSGGLDEARDVLGDGFEPVAFADLNAIIGAVQPFLAADPSAASALPYLEPLGLLVVGASESDGELLSETALTFVE